MTFLFDIAILKVKWKIYQGDNNGKEAISPENIRQKRAAWPLPYGKTEKS